MYNVKIKRETSKYNKYMLWHVTGQAQETPATFSDHCRTLKEALRRYSDTTRYNIIERP